MDNERLFLRIDTYNQLELAKRELNERNIEEVMSLYHVLCSFNQVQCEEYYIMTDKNQFRYIEQGDIIKVVPVKERKWYLDFVDFVREELRLMWELVK